MSAIAPDALGTVVARDSGNQGGTFGDIPFRRQLVIADGPLAALNQRVSNQLRAAGFRQPTPAELMRDRPTRWQSATYRWQVRLYVWLLNPGDREMKVRVPPGKFGLIFEVLSGG